MKRFERFMCKRYITVTLSVSIAIPLTSVSGYIRHCSTTKDVGIVGQRIQCAGPFFACNLARYRLGSLYNSYVKLRVRDRMVSILLAISCNCSPSSVSSFSG